MRDAELDSAWRPLVDVVKSQPLAVCHSASLREKDLIACDMIYPHVTTEIFHVLHNPNQKWYFLREQKQDEVLLMRNYGPNGALGQESCDNWDLSRLLLTDSILKVSLILLLTIQRQSLRLKQDVV